MNTYVGSGVSDPATHVWHARDPLSQATAPFVGGPSGVGNWAEIG